MIPADDFNKRKGEIKYYVSVANFEEAIKRLIDLTRDFCIEEENIAIGISTSYYIIYKAELKGTLAFSDALREKKVIAQNILNTLPLITQNLSAA